MNFIDIVDTNGKLLGFYDPSNGPRPVGEQVNGSRVSFELYGQARKTKLTEAASFGTELSSVYYMMTWFCMELHVNRRVSHRIWYLVVDEDLPPEVWLEPGFIKTGHAFEEKHWLR